MARCASACGVAMVLASSAACTYDFDEPFSKQGEGAGGATASASGPTATSSAASAGAGGAAGAGGGHGEQCANGTDDDEDGLIDCADPDCGDFTCVPVAPAGWSGPSAFSLQPNATCPAGATPLAGGTAPIDAPATCSACTCGAPAGGTCGLPQTTVWDGNACGGPMDDQFTPGQANTCDTFHVSDFTSGVQGDAVPLDSPPTCAATGGVLDAQPATFAASAVLCVTPEARGCDAGEICIAKPGANFLPDACIHQLGDTGCPTGFGQKTLYFQGKEDMRACSMCACDPADDATCTGKTDLYQESTCGGSPVATVIHDQAGGCVGFPANGPTNSYIYVPDPGPQGGTCAPTGGALGGSVSGTDPITVCCPG